MAKINGNVMAQVITLQEGKKVSVDIAQVKEVMRLVRRYLSQHTDEEVTGWVRVVKRSTQT